MTNRLPETNPLPNPNDSILTVPTTPPKPTQTTRVINKLIYLALITVSIALGIMIYWSLATDTPLEVKNSPFPARVVADPTGETGGTVYLKAVYCKNTDAIGTARISFLSKSREQFIPLVEEKEKQGCGEREFPVIIPTNLSEDEYRIRFRVLYDLNPLKKQIPVEFESQPVNIGSIKN